MQRSKGLALMFVLGALLVGGVLGFSADRIMVKDRLCEKAAPHQSSRDRFGAQLDLSPEQRVRLDTILDAKHSEITSLLRPIQPQLDSVSANARAQIRAMLNEQQRSRFDDMRRRSRERAAQNTRR